jgi:hypothetical protein
MFPSLASARGHTIATRIFNPPVCASASLTQAWLLGSLSRLVMVFDKLKSRWGVDSDRRFIVILIVFSLSGSSILWVKTPIYSLLGISQEASLWVKVPVCILIYQVFLMAWGTVAGEFRFFWEKEKKLGRWILKLCSPSTYSKTGASE